MTRTKERKPKARLDQDHEFLPGGYVRCIPHDFTAKGMPLIRHSLSEHLVDTIIRFVLQVALFMSLGYGVTWLLVKQFG